MMHDPEFAIQNLYLKDVSFETPDTPEIFLAEWKPKINIDLDVKNRDLQEHNAYEVVIKITVTAKLDDKIAFLAEVNQAGIFTLKNFPDNQLDAMLGSFCPSILFPYVREAVSDLVMRGGFPPLHLAPINFDALYQEQLSAEKGGEKKIIH